MKLGVCTDVSNIRPAAELGFDYIEYSLSALAAKSEAEFEEIKKLCMSAPIPVSHCNGMVPGEVRLTGKDADESTQRGYLERALSRAAAIGVKTVVLGSGAARQIPADTSFAEGWRQFANFLRIVEEYAAKYDIHIALEPLRRQECNILNLVSEATLLAGLVNRPHIGVLGDTFHMLSSQEPWSAMENAGDRLWHVHISRPLPDMSGRIYPSPDDGVDYQPIFDALRRANYDDGISIEAGTSDFAADAARAMQVLRPLAK